MSAESGTVEAVIFDLDGLIVDSETPDVLAWQAVYARYGMEFPVALWLQNVGRRDNVWDPLVQFRRPDSPAAPETVAALRQERAEALMADYLKPLPGVVPLLAALRQCGMRTAVASSSRRAWVSDVLARLGLEAEFDAAAGGDEVRRAKPAPDIYLLAARRLGTAPEACAALEDSPSGVRSARAAGIVCIAVPSPLTRQLDFSAADLVVGSLEEVTPEVILALGRQRRSVARRRTRA